MKTKDQLARMSHEEMLISIMHDSACITQAGADCLQYGYDLSFGVGTNMEALIEKKKSLDQIVTAFLLRTRG